MRGEAGLTLIEVLVATLLIGVALVPLMQLYPGLLQTNRQDETTMRLGTVAVRQTETIITSLRGNISSVASGAATCADLPACLVQWTIAAEATSAAQGVGQLIDVTVVACVDSNGNSVCDTAEPQVRYDAKVTSRP